MINDIKHKKSLYIKAQGADPSPPLGTILGNIGVNTVNFCNVFNTYTNTLPNYFLLKVNINIFDNRTFIFTTSLPTLGFICNLLKFEKIIKIKINDRMHDKLIMCINLYSLLKLIQFKYGFINFNNLSIVKGVIKSMNLVIVKK